MPRNITKITGASAIIPIKPKPSAIASTPSCADASPTVIDVRNVTAIEPVATPPASNAILMKSLSQNHNKTNTNR